ncbi:hypothetical protein BEP19_12610 [Ammoniphilus oxalaticus]|uniref:AtpZ/AtpI family protein n=1 Tax=Ammoniphilus oxalaticus TaxID=66863 RepID=A0A419SGX1_9BACL|nr:hypothetical protein BEP19_12610 [Ammoniphilus oxalaticus]
MPNPQQSPWKGLSLVSVIGMDVGIGTYVGVWLGKKVDVYLNSAPWGLVGGVFVGVATGVLVAVPIIKRLLGDS